jgi:hypothetical protein
MMVEEKTNEVVEIEKRNFFGPDEEAVYFIVAPTAEDIRGADWQYSKYYTRSLVEGITTSAEMMDILMRRGIIGPEFEQRANELAVILSEKIEALENTGDIEDKRDLSVEVAIAREELFQWNQRLNGPMSNTCEQIADDARLEYLTSCIVRDEKDNKVWNTYDAFLKEKSNALALKARFEVMLYLQGLEPDFIEKTPEAVAMKEVEADVLDKAKEAIQAAKALAEEEAAEKRVSEKKASKKTATKKPNKKTTKKSNKKDIK